jgi:hypothetical protein
MHQVCVRGDSYPSLVRGRDRCWCDDQTAEDTSPHKSCSTASVGYASGPQFRRPSCRGGPRHGAPAPQPWPHMLRLAAIMCEALLCCAAATLAGFRVSLDVSYGGRHRALLDSVMLWWGEAAQAHVLRVRRHLCVTRSRDFLLSFVTPMRYTCPEQPCQFPHCLLHAAWPWEGGR